MSDSALVKNKEASITTTGIDIKCLRVDGRNLTMSVFRQIPKKYPFKNKVEPKGNIWGWVNYFWGDENGDLHIIWQKGNQLYRYPLRKRATYLERNEEHKINGYPVWVTNSDCRYLADLFMEIEDEEKHNGGNLHSLKQEAKKAEEKYNSFISDIIDKQLYIAT